jgi:hypothetical protein
VQVRCHCGGFVSDGAAEHVGERVGRIRRDDQRAVLPSGAGERGGRRSRGLADAALAGDDDQP